MTKIEHNQLSESQAIGLLQHNRQKKSPAFQPQSSTHKILERAIEFCDADLTYNQHLTALNGLHEIIFASMKTINNGWSYTSEACQGFISSLIDPKTQKPILADYLKLTSMGNVLYPPQFYFIALQMERYLLKKYPEKGSRLDLEKTVGFFYNQDHSILELDDDGLNIIVSGFNRIFDKAQLKPHLPGSFRPNDTYISLFSGPTIIPKQIATMLGIPNIITIDMHDEQILSSRGLCNFELWSSINDYPNQPKLFDTSQLKHTHLILGLPDDFTRIKTFLADQNLNPIILDDSRGSMLYLPPSQIEPYLQDAFSILNDGSILCIGYGIVSGEILDIALRKLSNKFEIIYQINNKLNQKPKNEFSQRDYELIQILSQSTLEKDLFRKVVSLLDFNKFNYDKPLGLTPDTLPDTYYFLDGFYITSDPELFAIKNHFERLNGIYTDYSQMIDSNPKFSQQIIQKYNLTTAALADVSLNELIIIFLASQALLGYHTGIQGFLYPDSVEEQAKYILKKLN